jgi:glutathione S-transferase
VDDLYIVYGGELSYFTRKLEAALIFYGVDYEIRAKTPDVAANVEARSGTHQVPVLQTPENWMIGDTTPILHLMDSRVPGRRMFPAGVQGIMVQIIEELFDEWVARVMVHYRWHYPDSAIFASERMAQGNSAVAERVRAWGPRACRATGTDTEHQQKAAEAEYMRILTSLEAQLGQTRYALGDRPCAVDCILLGGLRAHTNMDPDPKKVVSGFPAVVTWSTGSADEWDGDGELADFPETTPFARFALEDLSKCYRPFVLNNADALAAGAKAFHFETYGEEVSYLTRPYPELSRNMIRRRIEHELQSGDKKALTRWLDSYNLADCFI